MSSQITLSREEAEKINTRLLICKDLAVLTDSLESLILSYQQSFDLLEHKIQALKDINTKVHHNWQICEMQLDSYAVREKELSNELDFYIKRSNTLMKQRKRRWWFLGGGVAAGVIGTILIMK